jgi:hypothetical protein
MNPATIFQILTQNGGQLLEISKVIGLQNIINVAPHIEAIVASYTSGGLVAVLTHNGADIQAVIQEIGLPNISTLAPNAAAIVKTLTAA